MEIAVRIPHTGRQANPAFVRSWSAELVMWRTDGRMFEYACHEANYSMANLLSGARYAEKDR